MVLGADSWLTVDEHPDIYRAALGDDFSLVTVPGGHTVYWDALAETNEALNLVANVAGDLEGAIHWLAALPKTPNHWTPEAFTDHRSLVDEALRPPGAFVPAKA